MKWWDPVIELMICLKSNSLQLDSFVFFFLRHLIFFVCHTNRNSYFYCRKWFFFCCWCYFDCFVCSSCGSQWGRLISGCKWTFMALKIERWKHPLCYSYICFILLYVRLMYVMGEVALKLFFMYFLFISLSGRSRAGFIWWRRVSLLFHKRSERSILTHCSAALYLMYTLHSCQRSKFLSWFMFSVIRFFLLKTLILIIR